MAGLDSKEEYASMRGGLGWAKTQVSNSQLILITFCTTKVSAHSLVHKSAFSLPYFHSSHPTDTHHHCRIRVQTSPSKLINKVTPYKENALPSLPPSLPPSPRPRRRRSRSRQRSQSSGRSSPRCPQQTHPGRRQRRRYRN